jgi:DNA polymerase-3 subunit delta
MKLAASKVDAFVRQFSAKDGGGRVILLYGRDQGAIRDTAQALGAIFLGPDPDPLQRSDLSETDLSGDAARLRDEAASLPMFGGDKLIMVRGGQEPSRKAVENYFEQGPIQEALVIVEAGNLTPASGLRKLVEADEAGLALPFYEADPREVETLIRDILAADDLKIDAAALASLRDLLGADRGVARREIERLVLYKGPKGSARPNGSVVTLDDVYEAMHDQSHAALDGLVDAVALGALANADKMFNRLILTGTRPEAIISAVRRHLQILHLAKSKMENGVPRDEALKSFKPPLHFKRKPLVERQCGAWSRRKIEAALDILRDTELACRQTGTRPETRVAYDLLRLARAAQR